MMQVFAQRTANMLARRSATAARAMSTKATNMKLKGVEGKLNEMHWKDVKDEVSQIANLMNEAKTNHSVKHPTESLEKLALREVEQSLQKLHEEAFMDMKNLKASIKAELYA